MWPPPGYVTFIFMHVRNNVILKQPHHLRRQTEAVEWTLMPPLWNDGFQLI